MLNLKHSWKVGVWGQCGTTCGYSLKARSIDCINEIGRHVNDTYCTERMPKMVEQCYSGQCPPEWVSGPWGEVSSELFKVNWSFFGISVIYNAEGVPDKCPL